MSSSLKTYWTKLKGLISKCCKSYSEWLNKQRQQKHVRFVKKKARLDFKIQTLDQKLALYLKKTETKKQKLKEKLK